MVKSQACEDVYFQQRLKKKESSILSEVQTPNVNFSFYSTYFTVLIIILEWMHWFAIGGLPHAALHEVSLKKKQITPGHTWPW